MKSGSRTETDHPLKGKGCWASVPVFSTGFPYSMVKKERVPVSHFAFIGKIRDFENNARVCTSVGAICCPQ